MNEMHQTFAAAADAVARLAWVAKIGAVEVALGLAAAISALLEDARPEPRAR